MTRLAANQPAVMARDLVVELEGDRPHAELDLQSPGFTIGAVMAAWCDLYPTDDTIQN